MFIIIKEKTMGTKERKERQKTDMQKAILDAALKLFSDDGFENVTMRRIADTIEYSVGTIYLYFKDKNEILFELHKKGFEEFYKKQLNVQHIKEPKERLFAHGTAYIEFAMQNPEYYDVMFISRGPAKQMKEYQEWEEGLRTYDLLKLNIIQAQQTGYLAGVDVEVAAFTFWSLVHGISSLYIRDRLVMIPDDAIQYLIDGSLNLLKKLN